MNQPPTRRRSRVCSGGSIPRNDSSTGSSSGSRRPSTAPPSEPPVARAHQEPAVADDLAAHRGGGDDEHAAATRVGLGGLAQLALEGRRVVDPGPVEQAEDGSPASASASPPVRTTASRAPSDDVATQVHAPDPGAARPAGKAPGRPVIVGAFLDVERQRGPHAGTTPAGPSPQRVPTLGVAAGAALARQVLEQRHRHAAGGAQGLARLGQRERRGQVRQPAPRRRRRRRAPGRSRRRP